MGLMKTYLYYQMVIYLQYTIAFYQERDFDLSELNTRRKINSRLQGHPTNHDNLPGIRISSGSLGQGLSVGIGSALSKKLNNDESIVYVLTGDGELQEGQN